MPNPHNTFPTLAEITPARGEESTDLTQLREIATPLRELTLAVVSEADKLREAGVGEVEIEITGSERVAGTIILRLLNAGPRIGIKGKLGGELPTQRGVPYLATWVGSFFRRPDPSKEIIVEEGATVRAGDLIAWWFIDKNVQGPIHSDVDGIIHFETADGGPVTTAKSATDAGPAIEATTLYYIEKVTS